MVLMPTDIVQEIRTMIDDARRRTALSVNAHLTVLYWRIGERINREILREQRGSYGDEVVLHVSRQLTNVFGRGWSERQLRLCISLYKAFPDSKILHTLCAKLSWSHLRLLAFVRDPLKRNFYVELCQLENWSVRQLQERMRSLLYERTAISRSSSGTLQHELESLRTTGLVSPSLLLRDPYILDFLGLADRYLEKDLEDAVLRDLEQFLLELGAGFSFVARQKRISIDNDDFYIDLLLYNRKLRRLVVVDLKIGEFRPEYKGQMELYLRWLERFERESDELPPIGIIMCSGKKQEQIELLELDRSGIHVAEYLTVLPPRHILEARLQAAIKEARERLSGAPS